MLMLGEARKQAAVSIQRAQQRYKYYDKHLHDSTIQVGDWVLVRFSQEESGRLRKLSRPWHGPNRVASVDLPNVSVTKVYFSGDGSLQVHLLRVQPCPGAFPHFFTGMEIIRWEDTQMGPVTIGWIRWQHSPLSLCKHQPSKQQVELSLGGG